ncbi:MAG: Si-specific NAD(P)(+) transhydrogenase [Proteobacteria bacterium]|nr:Si-specific NAD(P)(+) transhydrogenase [Pseudomonadota bacterium]
MQGRKMRPKYDFDFLCIGSGPASQRAAVQAAKRGKRVAVVERNRDVGGVCLHKGTIPSKTFREAVLSFSNGHNSHGDHQAPRNGFGYGAAPSAEQLFARVAAIEERETRVLEDQLARNNVGFIHGTASFKDPHSLAVRSDDHHQVVSASKIFIGVGTRPVRPEGVPATDALVITSDEVLQLKELPRSMIVVGCGVVGIEYASMFANFGVQVTVVDARQRPLEFLDTEIVDELIHQMRDRNVRFHLGERVSHFEISRKGPRRSIVYLESGKKLVKDLVLFSTGRVGSTDALNLEVAGLTSDSHGRIKVNRRFRTKVPHIYAGGDVIGYPSLAATSSEQGRLAACHAFGIEAKPMAEHFPIGVYSIPEASMVGAAEQTLTERKIPYETGVARYREIARGQIMGDNSGFLKLLFHREDQRLLGVHAIGTGATELIHIGQTVLGLGGGLDYFLETVFNYPTLAECYKVAALDAYNKLFA